MTMQTLVSSRFPTIQGGVSRGENLWDETPANVNNSPEGPMPKEVWVVVALNAALQGRFFTSDFGEDPVVST
jgi:hypothetical protein